MKFSGARFGSAFGIIFWALAAWAGCTRSSPGRADGTDAGDGAEAGESLEAGTDSTDGGDGGRDAGKDGNIDAPEIELTYGACADVTPCGGDPKGTWRYSAGCIRSAVFANAKAQCPLLAESNVKARMRGVVTITDTGLDRNAAVDFSATLTIPDTCTQGFGCAAVPLLLTQPAPVGPGFDTATCTGTTTCTCEVAKHFTDQVTTTYTQSGSTLTTGASETFAVCVDGAKLSYSETTKDAFPATYELTR
jgi:hypothetical protein